MHSAAQSTAVQRALAGPLAAAVLVYEPPVLALGTQAAATSFRLPDAERAQSQTSCDAKIN